MCGIFGLFLADPAAAGEMRIRAAVDRLFVLSESRGREAAGLALRHDDTIAVYKRPCAASEMIRSPSYRRLFSDLAPGRPFAAIGHSRLVTNGSQLIHRNNQPVAKHGLVAVHNGIIVNDGALWRRHPEFRPESNLDTEILVELMAAARRAGKGLREALSVAIAEIDGTVSTAVLADDGDVALLATNTGSLHYAFDSARLVGVFASERFILDRALAHCADLGRFAGDAARRLEPGRGLAIDLASLEADEFDAAGGSTRRNVPPTAAIAQRRLSLLDANRADDPANAELRRCARCILPETMPFISFDDRGVCNYCADHVEQPLLGRETLEKALAPQRRANGRPDCLVGLSGGRDSSYGLHFVKVELNMNPIAFTYDWGMVTDLARRNQARLCGRLGVEHILVSADIAGKRRNIRRNVEAWLRQPDLGMVPLFMAGDKQYYYHAKRLMRETGVAVLFYLENGRYEQTLFKAGFCGVNERGRRIFDIPLVEKLRLAFYYVGRFARNPRYLNSSLFDTVGAFVSSYVLKHDFVPLFDFVPWREDDVVNTLVERYGWERASDTDSTWRIGDGTAAFYNFIYYTLAGFTEHDTFRSNQIRAGAIARDEALRRVREDNAPRWESMEWYARVVGFDLADAVRVIGNAPRLYRTE